AAKRAALAARAHVAVQAASQARAALMTAGLLKRSGPSSWTRATPGLPIEPIKAEQQPDQEERQRPVERVEPEESQQQAQPAKWHRQGWERLPSGKWLNPAEWTRLEDGTWQFLSEGSTLPPRRLLAEATPDQRAVYGDTNRSTPEEEGMSAE